MASSTRRGRLPRKAVHVGLALAVMLFFYVGLAVITIARRTNDGSFDLFVPRSDTAPRSSNPGRREIGTVVRALAVFAGAVADELLLAFWKRRAE